MKIKRFFPVSALFLLSSMALIAQISILELTPEEEGLLTKGYGIAIESELTGIMHEVSDSTIRFALPEGETIDLAYTILSKSTAGEKHLNKISVAISSFSPDTPVRQKKLAALILGKKFNAGRVLIYNTVEAYSAANFKSPTEESKKKASDGTVGLYLIK